MTKRIPYGGVENVHRWMYGSGPNKNIYRFEKAPLSTDLIYLYAVVQDIAIKVWYDRSSIVRDRLFPSFSVNGTYRKLYCQMDCLF